jgi:hypothetical protein
METKLRNALMEAGLDEGLLDLIANEPEAARKAAQAVTQALPGRDTPEDKAGDAPGRPTPGGGDYGTPFW